MEPGEAGGRSGRDRGEGRDAPDFSDITAFDPAATNPQSPLAAFNDMKAAMTPSERFGLAFDLANPFGKSTILDVLGVEKGFQALDAVGTGMFGPLGKALGMVGRAGMAGTGSNANFGGGFSGALGSAPGLDSGRGGPGNSPQGAPSMSETLSELPVDSLQAQIGNLAAQRQMMMTDFWKQDKLAELQQMLAEIEQMRQQMAPQSGPTPNVRI